MTKVKKYSWKVYSLDWTFKFTIKPSDVKSRLVFESSIEAGQWQFQLVMNKPVDYTDITNTDIIKVYCIDRDNPDWRIIYTWIVQQVIKRINQNYEEITLPLIWLWSVFNYKLFTWTKDDTPWNIISDIVDLINVDYNLFTKNLDTTWTNIKIDSENETLLKLMDRVSQASWDFYMVKADWEVIFQPKPTTPTHTLKLWRNVTKVEMKQDTEKLVNKLYLTWHNWTTPYEDLTSQTQYGLREKHISDTQIKQQDSADEFWNQYIADYKNPINQTTIEVNDEYDIESIHPWDTISVNWTEIQNRLIKKVRYYMDWVTLYLEDFESFWKEFNYLQI